MGKIIISVLATLMLLAMCGCNLEKIIARKDNAAVERVTAKKSLLIRVKAPIDSLYPCVVDTAIVYKVGKRDSIYLVDVQAIDTVNRKRIIDSLNESIGNCLENLQAAYNAGFNSKKKLIITIQDTLTNTIVNRRELDICNAARIAAINKSAAQESAKIIYKDDRTFAYYIIIGLIILLIISNVLWLKLKVLK